MFCVVSWIPKLCSKIFQLNYWLISIFGGRILSNKRLSTTCVCLIHTLTPDISCGDDVVPPPLPPGARRAGELTRQVTAALNSFSQTWFLICFKNVLIIICLYLFIYLNYQYVLRLFYLLCVTLLGLLIWKMLVLKLA